MRPRTRAPADRGQSYISGESYAGQYIPNIASLMLDSGNKTYYDLEATLIYDPSINSNAITETVPAPAFVRYWSNLFALNDTFMEYMDQVDQQCGLTKYLEDNLVYPPKGQLPAPPTHCNYLYERDIYNAAIAVNPCWDIYQVATTCPLLYDVLGFPGSIPFLPPGGEVYFNRQDVKKAINAPLNTHWEECSSKRVYNTSNGLSTDSNHGVYSSQTVLPGVIERSKRTIIGHGQLDFILLTNGTLLSIQNMTWHGKRGFQSPPTADFYVPPHPSYQDVTIAGHGVMGKTHTERNLTFVQVQLSGHMQPQYQPSSSFRHLEVLLGRVPSLSSTVPFTTSNDGLIGEPDGPQ
jgi:carboxypeptidase D